MVSTKMTMNSFWLVVGWLKMESTEEGRPGSSVSRVLAQKWHRERLYSICHRPLKN